MNLKTIAAHTPFCSCAAMPMRFSVLHQLCAMRATRGGGATRWAVLACLLIYLSCAHAQGQTGLINVNSEQTCAAVTSGTDGTMECGDTGEATTLTVGITPGTILTFQESALLPTGENGVGGCSGASDFVAGDNVCYRSTLVEFTVEATQIKTSRAMYGRELKIPTAYAGFHTKTFRRVYDPDQSDLAGKSTFFVPLADENAVFYPTVRIENILATSTQAPNISPTVIASDYAATEEYRLWGESDPDNTDFMGNIPLACQFTMHRDDYDVLGEIGRVIFDAPWVTSTAREFRATKKDEPGNYSCEKKLCCGALPGQIDIDLLGLNTCQDPTFCMERATWCDMNRVYYGDYNGAALFEMPGDTNDQNYDDDEDDDSCGSGDDDNESQGGGICDFSECSTGDLTTDQMYRIAQQDCDCSFSLTGDDPPANADFSSCVAICYVDSDDGDAGSSLDINLSSKQGFKSRRFGDLEDHGDDDEDDETNIANGTFLEGFGDGGKSCSGCDSPRRAFCPEACRDTSMQDLIGTPGYNPMDAAGITGKTHPACRMLRGMAPRVDVVYVGIDDGGSESDNDNTGMISSTCVDDCFNTPGCEPTEVCKNLERDALYDDTDNDVDRRTLVEGPYRVNWVNGVIPGLSSELFTDHPNMGGMWYNSEDNIRSRPSADDSFGSIDDDQYCSAFGLNDQSLNGELGTYVAECPSAMCIPDGNHQPDGSFFRCIDDDEDVYESFRCPAGFFPQGATAEDVRRICHAPYPRYSDDTDPVASESDGSNPDGMHPEDPFNYDPKPATVCPLTIRDRIPLLASDQRRFVDHDYDSKPRIATHTTGEAFALYGPYCHASYMAAYGSPEFAVRVIRRDLSTVDPLPTQNVTVTVFSESTADASGGTADVTKFYGVSDDGSMFVRLGNVRSEAGTLGVEMDDMIVVCNGTFNGDAGAPNPTYRMAGATSDPVQAAQSPWDIIAAGSSVFFAGYLQTVFGHGVEVQNSGFTGLLPIPQVLQSAPDAYDTRDYSSSNPPTDVGIKKGSGWFTVTKRQQSTYGTGYRQIGQTPELFANDANAQRACSEPRFSAVPGMIPGKDYTLQQRNYDSGVIASLPKLSTTRIVGKVSGNRGTEERYYRDTLPESTPAIVFGRLFEFMSLDTCEEIVAKLNKFGHLPKDYLRDTGSGKCGAPTQWIHDGKFYFEDPTVNNAQTVITLDITQANSRYGGTVDVIQRAVFVADPVPTCEVATNSADGSIRISAQNVGEFAANFIVTGSCDSGVRITATAALSIPPDQIREFTLLVSHDDTFDAGANSNNGTVVTNFTCDLFISNPGVADPSTEFFDEANLTNCELYNSDSGSGPTALPQNAINICTEMSNGCDFGPSTGDRGYAASSGSMMITGTIALVALVSAFLFMGGCAWMTTSQDKALYKAKLEKTIYESSSGK